MPKQCLQTGKLPRVTVLIVVVCDYPSSSSGWRYGTNGNSSSCRQPRVPTQFLKLNSMTFHDFLYDFSMTIIKAFLRIFEYSYQFTLK